MSEIIEDYNSSQELKNFLASVKENMQSEMSFSNAWQDAVCKIPNSYGLLRQDKELIYAFGNELGSTDVDGQIALCRLNQNLINSILNVAKEEKNKKSKLYFMLGTSLGICIAIILF